MRRLIIVCTVATMLCSCYTSRILVGDTKPKEPMIEVAKSHDAHFIGGLVKTAKNVAEEHIGDAENYMIRSQYGFGDIVLSAITAGIYTPTTSKYYVPIRYIDSFTPKEPKVKPEKNNGLMLMTDLDGRFASGGAKLDVVLGYKFLDHYVAGIGVGTGFGMYHSYEGKDKDIMAPLDIFVRMRYLLFNKKHTPYANLDAGVAKIIDEPEAYSAVFTPTVGYLMKIGRNVALDAGIGYRIDSGVKGQYYDYYDARSYNFRSSSSGFVVKVGFNIML